MTQQGREAVAGELHQLHAIMLSVQYQGHINPFVNLALTLASNGITVTFVHFQHVHHMLTQAHNGKEDADLFKEARDSGLDVRYETISDGFPLQYDREHNFLEYAQKLVVELPPIFEAFVGKKMKEFSSGWRNFIVTDTLYFWIPTVAKKYNIVSVSLWTQPALQFNVLYHWQLLQEKGHFPCKDDAEEEITYLPGIPSINTRDLNYIKKREASTVIGVILSHAFGEVKKADFILQNTVEELEPEVLKALNHYQQNYAIGPLNFTEHIISSSSPIKKSVWAECDCTKWLESKPSGSVLYVSFGSFVHSNKGLVDEMAYGLLLSGVNFLWVLRTGILSTGEAYNLPDGYQDKIEGKGLIIPWSNQIKVLSNPAIGGFLTHNGWNSTIESMWFGVPMICFPFAHDQSATRKLVVDDWKIGVNLQDDGKPFGRKQVAEKIQSFFSDGGGSDKLRENVSQMKDMIHTAFGIGGSSKRNFDQFLQDLKQKIASK